MVGINTESINDVNGNSGRTPEQLRQGTAKVHAQWLDTLVGNDEYGVSSIVDNAAGDFTINFTPTMASSTFPWSLGATRNINTTSMCETDVRLTSSSLTMQFEFTSNNADADPDGGAAAIVFGDVA